MGTKTAREFFKDDTRLDEQELKMFSEAGIYGFATKYAHYYANEKTKQQREVIKRLASIIQQIKDGYLSDDKERRLSLDITNAVLFLEAESLLKEIK